MVGGHYTSRKKHLYFVAKCSVVWCKNNKTQFHSTTPFTGPSQITHSVPGIRNVHTTIPHRVHLDYAGPIENRMIVVAVDSYSKWISAMVVRSSTSNVTIEQLRMLFAEHRKPSLPITRHASLVPSSDCLC